MDFNKFVKGNSLTITKKQIRNVQVEMKELVSFLQKNTHIENLSLIGLNIGDKGVEDLANLSNLIKLNLRNNDISDEGAIALAKGNFLKLTSLDLSCNKISDKGVEDLAKFSMLTSLDLSYNKIGEKGVKKLTELSKLISLDLSRNEISSQGALYLAKLSELTSLDLRHCGIGNRGAKALANLSKLTWLDLSNNVIYSIGAEALARGNFKQISLDLSNNKIDNRGAIAFIEASKALKDDEIPKVISLSLKDNNIDREYKEALKAIKTYCDFSLSRSTLKRQSSLEPEASSNQSPKKLKSDETNNQEMNQQAAQLLSETQPNRGRRRRSPLLELLCFKGSSSPRLAPSSELDEVLPASSSRELNSNNIEMVSKSQSR